MIPNSSKIPANETGAGMFACLAVALGIVVGSVLPAHAWRVVLDGDFPTYDPTGYALGVGVDGSGHVLASGYMGGLASDRLTTAIDVEDGNVEWISDAPPAHGPGAGMTLHPSGDPVLAALHLPGIPGRPHFHLSRLSVTDGSEVWTYDAPTPADSTTSPDRLFTSPSGDVFACGNMAPTNASTFPAGALAVRLDGSDGSELWRREDYSVGQPAGSDCALSADGATFCYGYHNGTDYRVVKLDPATGLDLWAATGYGIDAMRVDAAGDVLAAGDDGSATTVAKLDGTTGTEDWKTALPGADPDAFSLAVDAAGDVFVGGDGGAGDVPTLWKFSGTTGALLWTAEFPEFADGDGDFVRGIEPAGPDLVYMAASVTVDGSSAVLVAAIDPASGTEIWRHLITGTTGGDKRATLHAIALSPAGHPIVAGGAVQIGSGMDFLVARISGQLPGRKLVLGDSASNSARRKLAFQSRSLDLIAPTPGGPADPTATGATLTLYNPVTMETAVMNLPAANWRADVHSSGFRGYRYSDSALVDGPCKRVTWSVGKVIKFTCKGAGIDFSLDEAGQGSLALALDTPGLRLCSVFGGTVKRDTSTAAGRGSFVAKNAPEVDACPVP